MADTNTTDKPDKETVLGGLSAIRAQVGQLGSIGIVCAAFWLLLHNSIQQASEDRKLFREAVAGVSESVKKSGEVQAAALKDLAHQLEQLSRRQAPAP